MIAAFGGLESPAVCQPGVAVVVVLVGGRPAGRPAATLVPRKEPREPRGFAGADPGSRMGSNRIFEPGSTPARFEPPDRERSFCLYVCERGNTAFVPLDTVSVLDVIRGGA